MTLASTGIAAPTLIIMSEVWTQEKRARFAGNVYHAIQTPKWSSRQRYAVHSALLDMEAIEEADWPQIKMVIQQALEGAEESLCTCYVM